VTGWRTGREDRGVSGTERTGRRYGRRVRRNTAGAGRTARALSHCLAQASVIRRSRRAPGRRPTRASRLATCGARAFRPKAGPGDGWDKRPVGTRKKQVRSVGRDRGIARAGPERRWRAMRSSGRSDLAAAFVDQQPSRAGGEMTPSSCRVRCSSIADWFAAARRSSERWPDHLTIDAFAVATGTGEDVPATVIVAV
jgi:hypothetical protein